MNSHIIKSSVIFSVLQLLLSCNLNTDPELSNEELEINFPDSSRNLYIDDASRLALREIFSIGSVDTGKVEIPDDLVNTIYNGLLQIYNSISSERDSIFNIYLIHTFRNPSMHNVTISVDSTEDWVKSWRDGNRLTGNEMIDSIMNEYDLELEDYREAPWYDSATLFSDLPVNTIALATLFEPVDGVIFFEANGYGGDGNDVTAADKDTHWEFRFFVKWGDCIAGCISEHYWKFSVHPDGTVEFTGSGGSPLPF